MTVPTGPGSPPSHRLLGSLALAVVVLVAAVCWWLVEQTDSRPEGQPAPSPSATTTGPTAPPSASPTPPTAAPPSPDGEAQSSASATPSPGSLAPVPYAEVTPQPAIPLTATADFGTGLTVEISKVEPVRSTATRPGEISAPALRLTLRAHNGSARAIAVEQMVVTLEYGRERTPAVNVQEPGGKPFAGVLAPGASQRGVYVFNVPDPARDEIRVTTSYTGSAPTLVLAGSVA